MRESTRAHPVRGGADGGTYSTARDLFRFHRKFSAGRGQALAQAGGAPGTNAVIEGDDTWVVIVVSNLDPPGAVKLGGEIYKALTK
jgi:hypothetical protein